jgi:pimeloyl-ACP methyl ester carboxylesterase
VHGYSYDILGRMKLDAVTTLGSRVDGSVRALGYSFNALGMPYQQTSYSNSSATTVVNQVQDAYNGYGQLTAQYQEHAGAVNTSTSLNVQYTYSQPSGANYSRLSGMTFPNGRVEDYVYNTGLDSDISRVSGISDDAGTGAGSVESYKFLGLDTIVQRTDGNGIELTYIKQSGESNGDAGDQYIGLDRFGRVADQRFIPVGSPSSPLDRFQYAYDRDGNVLYKNNLVNSSFSELYHANSSSSGDNSTAYDSLNRLTGFRRGTLSASGNNGSGVLDTVSTLNSLANSQQSFTLDAVGNQTSVTTDGTAASRTVNSQNQITALGSSGLAYDNNGNTTTDDQGHTFIYDAWNRQVAAKSGGTTLVGYTYDANFNRISRTASSTTTDFYVSSAGQVVEERQGSTATTQYVWGLGYVNDLVLRDDNSSSGSYGRSSSGIGRRIYVQQDADFNVTAILNRSGSVLERFVYAAYGAATALTSAWGATTDSYAWSYLDQGGRVESITNETHFEYRDESLSAYRWTEQDPTGSLYVNGPNLYQFEGSQPLNSLDPSGAITVFISGASRSWGRQYKSGSGMMFNDPWFADNVPGGRLVATHRQRDWVIDQIKKAKAANPCEPVILVGHSWGGQSAIDIANALKSSGIDVDLIVSIDPVNSAPLGDDGFDLPDNVLNGVNIYNADPGAVGGKQVTHAVNVKVNNTDHVKIGGDPRTIALVKQAIAFILHQRDQQRRQGKCPCDTSEK